MIEYFIECLQQGFSQSCQFQFLRTFIIRYFSFREIILPIFSGIGLQSNLITLLCFIPNHKHKENIFQFFLSFSFLPFLSSLKFKTINSTSQILWNRHFTFQCHCQHTLSGHSTPGLLKKSFIFIALFLIPFHSDLGYWFITVETISILCLPE